jgi:hypothetical protein
VYDDDRDDFLPARRFVYPGSNLYIELYYILVKSLFFALSSPVLNTKYSTTQYFMQLAAAGFLTSFSANQRVTARWDFGGGVWSGAKEDRTTDKSWQKYQLSLRPVRHCPR